MPVIDLAATGSGTRGRLDRLVGNYVFDHRPITLLCDAVRLATRESQLSAPFPILRSETLGIRHSQNTNVSITIGDLLTRLEVPLQSVTLLGTGGNEGDVTNKGQRPPLALGSFKNHRGLRISQTDQLYLIHRDRDGNALRALDEVRVGENLVDPDDYEVTLGASNTVLLKTDLLDGFEVTFTGSGPDAAGDTTSSIAQYMASGIGPLEEAELNTRRFELLAEQCPFQARFTLASEDETIADAIDRLFGPLSWWSQDAAGLLDIGLNIPPALDFIDYELPTEWIMEAEVQPIIPPARRVTTGWDPNPTELTEDGIEGAAKGTALAAWALTPYSKLVATNNQYIDVYKSARDADDYVMPFTEEADALRVHDWLASTYGVPMKLVRLILPLAAARFAFGRVIRFAYPRFGLDALTEYRIAQTKIQADWTVELIVWTLGTRYILGPEETSSYIVSYEGAPIGI